MKQEFLKTIGNCKTHDYMRDESASAEKIFNSVMEKVSLSQKRRKRKKALFCFVSGLAAATAIFFMFLSPWKDGGEDSRVARFQDGNGASIEKEKKEDHTVAFYVYEAKQREQTVMANYMDVMKKREVKTEKKIVLGSYNPVSSNVPGYPVMISSSKKNETDVKFSITALGGQFLQWNQETGDVKELGKSSTFKADKKIFWSPLNNGKLVEEAKIEVNLFIKDQLEDTVEVKIVMEKEGVYTAKRINKSIQKSYDEKVTSNEAMDNLNQYFSEHDFPDWFGDYYLENDNVTISLVDLEPNKKLQVQTWAKSQNMIFKKAKFSYNYLNSVLNNISDAIENKQITFIRSIWIDSKSNRIKVELNCEIKNTEKELLYSYDKKWEGDIFDVIDTINQVNQTDTSQKPLQDNDSQVIMKTKMSKKGLLEVVIKNICQEKISFASEYQLYRKSDDSWEIIDYLPNVGFKDLVYYLEQNETYLDKVDLKHIFGELGTGKYKIEKEIDRHKSRILVSSEFEISD